MVSETVMNAYETAKNVAVDAYNSAAKTIEESKN